MGVHGLWRLLDASGKPVPLETLEGKVLAIDVSIWIHQVLQGYQDRKGNAVPNAHLLGLFHRICKLLYFKIKPVFVFDGGVPMLKKNTIASRKKQKAIAATKAQQMKNDLIQNLIKHTAVKGVLAMGNRDKEPSSSQESLNSKNSADPPDMFKLPSMPVQNDSVSDEMFDDDDYDSESSVELSPRKQARWKGNIHNVDVTSDDFKALPADVRYDVLTDLKETRKQNSWGRLHEMPEVSHEFSVFQMERLLKRRRVQESLENAEKEMGGKTLTLEELERMLTEQGIETGGRDKAFRIAGDSKTRLIFINDPKGLKENSAGVESAGNSGKSSQSSESKICLKDKASMETTEESLIADINEYDLDSDWDSDNEIVISDNEATPSPILPKKYFGKQRLNPALAYMLEHAGLPQEQILAIIEGDRKKTLRNERSESRGDNETLIETKPPRQKSEDNESKVQSSESVSDFDNLLLGVGEAPKIEKSEERDDDEKLVNETSPPSESEKNSGDPDSKVEESSSKSVSEIDDSSKGPQAFKVEPVDHLNSQTPTIPNFPLKLNDSAISKRPISDSDTDSDLVEIPDIFVPKPNSGLEILVKSDELLKVEDDLFADVFVKEPEDISDTSARDNGSFLDSTPSTSFHDMEENFSTEDPVTTVQESKESISTEISVDPEPEQIPDKVPVTESPDSKSVASTSRAEELSQQVSKFKPELLEANKERLVSMQEQLETEHSDLTENIGKLERQATAVTDQMRMEAQDLLRLFGIPFIVAPMEAEAQCAYLESIELTDGTVTDDSDIWLFGGRCVYKNFFNNNKRVMQYKLNDIEHHFKLTRQQMIQLALLVGSDYTVGVPGIGPVTALEILAAFPTEGDDLLRGLGKFCSWLKTGRSAGPGRTTLRNKLRNVEIERGFPSQAVVQAYLFPTVDESKERFSWSKPNLTLLADYTRQKFGWTKLKFEETIGPVVKKLAEAKSQKGIASYFKVDTMPKSIETTMSKRVQKAVRRLANADEPEDDTEEPETSGKRSENKKRRVKRMKKSEEPTDPNISTVESMNGENSNDVKDKKESRVSMVSAESKVLKGNGKKIIKLPDPKNVDEYIPQRERDRAIAQKKKLRAIEIFKKSKKGPGQTTKSKRPISRVTKEAKLSESSDSS